VQELGGGERVAETAPGDSAGLSTRAVPPGLEAITFEDGQSAWDNFRRDPIGNTFSVIVLLGMIGVVVATPTALRRQLRGAGDHWVVPVLAMVGIVVAVYLTYVETSGARAVCGPVALFVGRVLAPVVAQEGLARIGALGAAGLDTREGLRFAGPGVDTVRIRIELTDEAASLLILTVGAVWLHVAFVFPLIGGVD